MKRKAMAGEMSGQVVLITGASRSLGLQLAREMAMRNAKLLLLDLPSESWSGIAEELKALGAGDVYTGSADVTKPDELNQAVMDGEKVTGPVTVLIANAGIGLDTTVSPFHLESIHRQASINYLGVANSIAAVLPGMIERKAGHLVAVVSLSSYRGLPGMAGYCSSKAAACVMMDSLRLDLKPFGIACTTLNPGWIDTGVVHTITASKPGVTKLPEAARRLAAGIVRRKPYICFPLWLRTLFILNRLQPTTWGDWITMQFWRWFTPKKGS
ncbi:MAG: SDR family NAD(P)-dependent oxidoreductase [Gemmatales bacterium]